MHFDLLDYIGHRILCYFYTDILNLPLATALKRQSKKLSRGLTIQDSKAYCLLLASTTSIQGFRHRYNEKIQQLRN